jgi:thiamine phosphate synthase YjbQ (UPF0047 family)
MSWQTCFFDVLTRGKGLNEITPQVQRVLQGTSIREGVVTIFIRHTSASLVIFENADPSRIRMSRTRTSEVVPVSKVEMVLGTWEGIFLFEHRRAPESRQITVNVMGC